MALNTYTPAVLMFFDGLSDLDKPTGATVTNPVGAAGTLTIAGSPDSYAALEDDVAKFAVTPTAWEVGTGDITVILKARITGSVVASEYLVYDYDGSGTAHVNNGTTPGATGIAIRTMSGTQRRIGLTVPPSTETASAVTLECSNATLVLGQDFIIAFRRQSGVWSIWLDVDASGGMVTNTPFHSGIGADCTISECEGPTFGGNRTGGATVSGTRLYWYVVIPAAVSDSDIQLSDWDNEANLKAAWLSGAGDETLVVEAGYAVGEGSQVTLISTTSVVMPVTSGDATFEGQPIPFALSKNYDHGEAVGEGSEINLLTAPGEITSGSAVGQGQTILMDLGFPFTYAQAVGQGSNVTLGAMIVITSPAGRKRDRRRRTIGFRSFSRG